MKLKHALAAAAATLGAAGSQAAVFDFSSHDSIEVSASVLGGFVGPGAFADIFKFTLGGSETLSSSVVSNNVPGLNIFGGTYALYSYGADNLFGTDDDASVSGSAWAYNGTTGSIANMVSLTAGNYYYVVSGIANGQAGGLYTLASSTVPVPEPETYAMLLAGLGVVGFVARRRRSA